MRREYVFAAEHGTIDRDCKVRAAGSLEGEAVLLGLDLGAEQGAVRRREFLGKVLTANFDRVSGGLLIQLECAVMVEGVELEYFFVRPRFQGEGYAPLLAHFLFNAIASPVELPDPEANQNLGRVRYTASVQLLIRRESGELLDPRPYYEEGIVPALRRQLAQFGMLSRVVCLFAGASALLLAWDQSDSLLVIVALILLPLVYLVGATLALILAHRAARALGAAVLLHFVGCTSGAILHRYEIEATVDRCDEIFAAISEFRNTGGEYPGELKELVPRFLPDVDSPRFGPWRERRKVYYSIGVGLPPTLSFDAGGYVMMRKTIGGEWMSED